MESGKTHNLAKPLTRKRESVTAEMAWERITYFLERIIPVCEEYAARQAACHPHDPGVPVEGYQGVYRVLGTIDGLKRFVSICESKYHGLNFCIGTLGENLNDPGREIHDVIRYFGTRGKIFNIHFRNIRGSRDNFSEVYPDEGDMNMVRVARTLRDVGYEGMLMPDHMPHHPDDPDGNQAFAYCYGYIKAILQTPARGHSWFVCSNNGFRTSGRTVKCVLFGLLCCSCFLTQDGIACGAEPVRKLYGEFRWK